MKRNGKTANTLQTIAITAFFSLQIVNSSNARLVVIYDELRNLQTLKTITNEPTNLNNLQSLATYFFSLILVMKALVWGLGPPPCP
jgi:hypothetical protein